jgi:hypothetical protein
VRRTHHGPRQEVTKTITYQNGEPSRNANFTILCLCYLWEVVMQSLEVHAVIPFFAIKHHQTVTPPCKALR